MKVKIAKVTLSLHEVEIKGVCANCGNKLASYDGDKMFHDYVRVGSETVYLDPRAKDKNFPLHRMGDSKSEKFIVGLSCGGCGEVIIGKDSIVEPLSEKEREYYNTMLKNIGQGWTNNENDSA